MKAKTTVISLLLVLAALAAFGHAGEVHKYMGTVTAVHDDGSFLFETKDGKSLHVLVSKRTTWLRADGSAAAPSDLAAGARAVVTISVDGKTASEVKLAAKK